MFDLGPRDLAQHARRRPRCAQDDPLRRGDRPRQVLAAPGRRDEGDGPTTPECELGGQLGRASGTGVVSDGDEDLVRDVPAGRAPSREEHRDGRAHDRRLAVALRAEDEEIVVAAALRRRLGGEVCEFATRYQLDQSVGAGEPCGLAAGGHARRAVVGAAEHRGEQGRGVTGGRHAPEHRRCAQAWHPEQSTCARRFARRCQAPTSRRSKSAQPTAARAAPAASRIANAPGSSPSSIAEP